MTTLEKIKYLRKRNNLTQNELGRMIGTSGSNYSRYESGEWSFTLEHIKKLSKIFNISIATLLEETNDDIIITPEDFNKLVEAKNVILKIENNIKNKGNK